MSRRTQNPALRNAAAAIAALATTAAVSAGATVAGAALVARRVLTPDRERPDDLEIVDLHLGERRLAGPDAVLMAAAGFVRAIGTVTTTATPEAEAPGLCGIWFDGMQGHLRAGPVEHRTATSLTRPLLAVDRGTPSPGPGRFNSYWHWDDPGHSLGRDYRTVAVLSDLGPMPAWLVPPAEESVGSAAKDVWAILVHGRGGSREETLRAVPVFAARGVTTLIPMYRNDVGAPRGPDGRYNLGLSEWRDLDAAMRYATEHGARRIVLAGWSMGAAIVLQALSRSDLATGVVGAFLDSPVVDWADVLRFQATLYRVPQPLVSMATRMMGDRSGRRLVGVHDPVDLALTDWVARSSELRHPLLIVHSHDDGFVPIGPSLALAQARPDLVRLHEWHTARHVMEWNTDPVRWESALGEFVAEVTSW